MKFIHTADIHLGSKNDSRFPKEISDEIKGELRSAFKNLVEYAKSRGVSLILLSGDVFDSDRPFKKDKDFFYSVVKNNPEINFLYLKGNHDRVENFEEELPNLKRFSDKWTVYEFGGLKFYGIEMTKENSSSLYSTLNLTKEDKNVVLMHGQKGSGRGDINLLKLRDKNIDYLALGHIHSFSAEKFDDRGVAVYSGCLLGRGYDEIGEKGFVIVNEENGKFSYEFKTLSTRVILEETVDVSGVKDAYEAAEIVKKSVTAGKKDILRVILTGELETKIEDLSVDLERLLLGRYAFLSVKDKTKLKLDLSAFSFDNSLIGEFIRTVEKSEYPEEDKQEIISYGLRALKGESLE